jgi:XTP/dITP diphosphohydrolase
MKLVFATNNLHKLNEIRAMINNDNIELICLKDLNFHEDIPEPYNTIEENALVKVSFIKNKYGIDGFADDTALEIDALNGKPGVFSARYAGSGKNPEDNMQKVLYEMRGIENRKARFRTVIALIINHVVISFEGIVEGKIIHTKKGSGGFGYDPIFIPGGYSETFAEMPLDLKNAISHRGKAFGKLVEYLNNLKL